MPCCANGVGHIDNSFITGEPLPSRKEVGETVKAGGRQRGAVIELEVVRSFAESRLKRLWAEQARGRTALRCHELIDQVARRFTIAVLLIALGAALYWWGKDPAQVWPVVTAVLIVACPCALALSMPFAYGHTIRLMGKKGLFLRDAEVVERMAHVDTVVFDKTGTLTAREAHEVMARPESLVDRGIAGLVRSLVRNSTHPLSSCALQRIESRTCLP
jgi:Cu+-exporting ATPase